jgi:hypothetical protein
MRWGFAFALLVPSILASAQDKVYVSGFVSDLTTLQPLSYVNISSNGRVLSSTDPYGSFTVSVERNDTIVFTRLGYKPYIHVADDNSWGERVMMSEMSMVLEEVVISDHYKIHGYDQIQKGLKDDDGKALKNFTMYPENNNRMVQTFGPSMGIAIPWDKWGKKGREKKKLQRVLSENERTAVYSEFIHSIEVEDYMKKSFNLDHDTYLKYKEGFIVAHPDARFLRNRQDIIDLMVAYFAAKEK